MFETQYNDEMEQEVLRLEAMQRALAAGHPEWQNACSRCHGQLTGIDRYCSTNCQEAADIAVAPVHASLQK